MNLEANTFFTIASLLIYISKIQGYGFKDLVPLHKLAFSQTPLATVECAEKYKNEGDFLATNGRRVGADNILSFFPHCSCSFSHSVLAK